MSIGRDSKNSSARVCNSFFFSYCFFLIDYSEVTLQTSEALALSLWGSCTSGTAVEGVVNEDVAVHAEQMSTLRT